MRKIIYILITSILVSGCATTSLSKIASNNANNLSKLRVGMSEQEVLNIMGTKKLRSGIWNFYTVINNPYRTEITEGQNGKTVKTLYYFTNTSKTTTWEKHSIRESELTPLIFEDGKLIEWDSSILQK